MRLRLKKFIHLLVILIALIETFTGAVVDCVICTILYPTDTEYDGFYCYFTTHLLPTKHFYRLIIVLYVPVLYLWRGVDRIAEGSLDLSAGSERGRSRVLGVIYTHLPLQIVSTTAGWLRRWLVFLQSTSTDAPVAHSNSDAECSWAWLRKFQWHENWKYFGTLVHCSGQQRDSVITQYNTRFALYRKLPWKYISRVYGALAVREMPLWLRRPCLRLYIWLFRCRLEEAAVTDLRQYRSLAEFFRRSLRPGIRPVDTASALTSPADGLIMLCSKVINGELEQIKGVTYSLPGFIGPYLDRLLSYSLKAGQQFDDHGTEIDFDRAGLLTCRDNHLYQCVIYLSPGEYHHFHSPADWIVTGRRHFPGELFSVNPGVVRWLQGLFNFNERVMYVGNWKHGFFSVNAVGATLVGSINVHFDKELSTNEAASHRSGCFYDRSFVPNGQHAGDAGIRLRKGEEMGAFCLGSTIVLLFEAPPNFQFSVSDGQNVKYGEALTGVNS